MITLLFYLLCKPHTRCRNGRPTGIPAADSEQITLRHTGKSSYCCFRQDLTRFVATYCTGSIPQHHLPTPYITQHDPRPGIQPRYSGLRVQGTANCPLSTASILYTNPAFCATFSLLYTKLLQIHKKSTAYAVLFIITLYQKYGRLHHPNRARYMRGH